MYKLTYLSEDKEEFIGYSINLAARLQGYCREIGFVVSGRLNIPPEMLAKNNYVKLVAKAIRGFPHEIVIVDDSDYKKLQQDTQKCLFEPIVAKTVPSVSQA